MGGLKLWTYGPFELILHAELHLRNGDDFDRRLALISFDNSIEVSITTYLTLNPLQRGGQTYPREDVEKWLRNFHTKLEFFELELKRREIPDKIDIRDCIWYHDIRNKQYHGGSGGVPDGRDLDGIRDASLCVFSILFDVSDVEEILNEAVETALRKETKPERDPDLDQVIDDEYELIDVADQIYTASEILYATDSIAYWTIGKELLNRKESEDDESTDRKTA